MVTASFLLLNKRAGGRGRRTKPGQKPVEKPSAARFAHPLRGAEVLVAVRGPSPGEGGGKNAAFWENRKIKIPKKIVKKAEKQNRCMAGERAGCRLLSYFDDVRSFE